MPVFATACSRSRSSSDGSPPTVILPFRMSKLRRSAPPTSGPTTSLRTATSSAQSMPRTLNTRRSSGVRLRSLAASVPISPSSPAPARCRQSRSRATKTKSMTGNHRGRVSLIRTSSDLENLDTLCVVANVDRAADIRHEDLAVARTAGVADAANGRDDHDRACRRARPSPASPSSRLRTRVRSTCAVRAIDQCHARSRP